jgi:hypothetical protein
MVKRESALSNIILFNILCQKLPVPFLALNGQNWIQPQSMSPRPNPLVNIILVPCISFPLLPWCWAVVLCLYRCCPSFNFCSRAKFNFRPHGGLLVRRQCSWWCYCGLDHEGVHWSCYDSEELAFRIEEVSFSKACWHLLQYFLSSFLEVFDFNWNW